MGCLCSINNNQRKNHVEKDSKFKNTKRNLKKPNNTEKKNKRTNIPHEKAVVEQDNIIKLDEFQKVLNIQDDFYIRKEDENDYTYYELKKYEREKLEEKFNNECKNFENDVLSKFKLENIGDKLIDNIKNNEYSNEQFQQKISQSIENICNNDALYNVEYLTILLVGRKNVGKTTLINYILESENGGNLNISNDNPDFVEYKSAQVSHLKLIEFKGIGYNEGNSAEAIGNEATKLISDLIEGINRNDYNDYIHCIWYCITNTRFEKAELDVLKKLKKSYDSEDIMPIIVVYTQTEDDNIADDMCKVVKEQQKGISCVKTIAKDIPIGNNEFIFAKGKDELLQITLEKCTKALKGKMINLMINKISKDLERDIKDKNKENEKNIFNEIINEFTNDYNKILKNEDFIDYIIKILIIKLKKSYCSRSE